MSPRFLGVVAPTGWLAILDKKRAEPFVITALLVDRARDESHFPCAPSVGITGRHSLQTDLVLAFCRFTVYGVSDTI
jgi:hypothetical protein